MWKQSLRKLIRIGKLEVVTPNGQSVQLGGQSYGGEHRDLDIKVRLIGALTPLKLAADPHRFLGEAYMNGDLVLERGTLWEFMELIGYNFQEAPPARPGLLGRWGNWALRTMQQRNGLLSSRRNVSHHYDLSEDLYRLFLDCDMQYSCAYFRSPSDTLEDAQRAKKQHIAAKLLLEQGMRVLDIGCGWGGMAIYLAETHRVRVHGITLSTEQLAVAQARAKARGLQDRVTFELMDYRKLDRQFDRVVSVGMFEHVGAPHFQTYFDGVARLLTPDGVALVHSIGRKAGPSRTAGFLRRHIFPGGYIPALSEVMPAVERSGLWLTDLEILRVHYAETLKHWRERFMANLDRLPAAYDARFQRMWEFYLASSEMSFRFNGFMVFQVQLARRIDAVPITRDYMVDGEHMRMAAE